MSNYRTTDTDSIIAATFGRGQGAVIARPISGLMRLFQNDCTTTDVDAIFSSGFGAPQLDRVIASWASLRGDSAHLSKRGPIERYARISARIRANLSFRLLEDLQLCEVSQRLPRSGRILDLGCGAGFFANYFALTAEQRSVVGLDPDPQCIREARGAAAQLRLSNVSFELNDLLEWKTSERFDAICLLDVLRETPTRALARFLARVVEGLAPGGQLLITESELRPHWQSLISQARRNLGLPFGSSRRLTHEELTDMLARNGLEVSCDRVRESAFSTHRLYDCRRR